MPARRRRASNIGRRTRNAQFIRMRRIKRRVEECKVDNSKAMGHIACIHANESLNQRHNDLHASTIKQREGRQRQREYNQQLMQDNNDELSLIPQKIFIGCTGLPNVCHLRPLEGSEKYVLAINGTEIICDPNVIYKIVQGMPNTRNGTNTNGHTINKAVNRIHFYIGCTGLTQSCQLLPYSNEKFILKYNNHYTMALINTVYEIEQDVTKITGNANIKALHRNVMNKQILKSAPVQDGKITNLSNTNERLMEKLIQDAIANVKKKQERKRDVIIKEEMIEEEVIRNDDLDNRLIVKDEYIEGIVTYHNSLPNEKYNFLDVVIKEEVDLGYGLPNEKYNFLDVVKKEEVDLGYG